MNTPREDACDCAASKQAAQVDQADAAAVASAVFLIQKMDCPTEGKLDRDACRGWRNIDELPIQSDPSVKLTGMAAVD